MAAYSIGGAQLWSTLTGGAVEQATLWLGDMGVFVALIVGAGLVLLIITAIVTALRKL